MYLHTLPNTFLIHITDGKYYYAINKGSRDGDIKRQSVCIPILFFIGSGMIVKEVARV